MQKIIKEIIKQKGACQGISCVDCPFDQSHHTFAKTCTDLIEKIPNYQKDDNITYKVLMNKRLMILTYRYREEKLKRILLWKKEN